MLLVYFTHFLTNNVVIVYIQSCGSLFPIFPCALHLSNEQWRNVTIETAQYFVFGHEIIVKKKPTEELLTS